MICKKCKKEFNTSSKTSEEAMKKYIAIIKKDNKKFKEKDVSKKKLHKEKIWQKNNKMQTM